MADKLFKQNKIPIKLSKKTIEVWEEDNLDGHEVVMNDYDVALLRAIKWFQKRISEFINDSMSS